jgi:AcrR family transcriptional regulator
MNRQVGRRRGRPPSGGIGAFGTVLAMAAQRGSNAPGAEAAIVPRRRPGGRSARVRDAVLTSTIEVLAERGVVGVTVDSVAKRAGVNPTTVYRRWPTINGLIMEALSANSADVIPLPDTGSVRGDLTQVLAEVRAYITSPPGRALVNSTIGATRDADVAALRQAFWSARFAVVAEVVRRGVDRGELPTGIDERFLIETATAPLYFRIFVVAGTVDDDLIDRIVQLVVGGARHGLV